MSYEDFYYKLTDLRTGELVAIIVEKPSLTTEALNRNGEYAEGELGFAPQWDSITQAEFETYQAFGIKEIKP